MKTIELIAMVYKSEDYLKLISEQMYLFGEADGWTVSRKIIANDPTQQIIDLLPLFAKTYTFDYEIYNDPKPSDYYLNRVYRCWNHAGKKSKANSFCFLNSDMMLSEDWLTNLLKYHDGKNIPCSRLVESGKLLSGQYAISRDFGREPKTLNQSAWSEFALSLSRPLAPYGGLYMPCVFETQRFIESGGYPEGNIYSDGPGTLNGPVLQTGDNWYFKKLEKEYRMKHITVFDSLVYHIQEGELHSND